MKTKLIFGLLCLATCLPAQVITTNSYTVSPGLLLADNNASGWSTTFNVSGVAGTITNVQVALDIAGGYNGDLYAYLVGADGQMAILLNRVGLSSGNPYGYDNAGFNLTLDSSAANNVHDYQNFSPNYSGGQLTGSWAPDGRNLDPQAAGSLFDSTGSTLGLNAYFGGNPNGGWTLFFADLSPGGQSTLQSLTLNIMTVPEPSTSALLILAAGFGVCVLIQRFKRQPTRGK